MLTPHLHVPSGNTLKGHRFTFILSALDFKELSFVWIYFRGVCVCITACQYPSLLSSFLSVFAQTNEWHLYAFQV